MMGMRMRGMTEAATATTPAFCKNNWEKDHMVSWNERRVALRQRRRKERASSYLVEVHEGNRQHGVDLADVFGESVENSSYREEQNTLSPPEWHPTA